MRDTDKLAWLFKYRTFVIADFIEKAWAGRNKVIEYLQIIRCQTCCILLYCIVYYFILYSVLCYFALYCIVHCIVLYLYCVVYCIVLYGIVLYSVLHCIV